MSLIPGEPPLPFVPSLEDRQHIPFLTAGDIGVVRPTDFGPETRLAASALFQACVNRRLREWVRRDLGLGWALDPQLRFLQLAPAFVESRSDRDRARLAAERAFLSEAAAGVDLLGGDVSLGACEEVARNILDSARNAWATALLTPSLAHLDGSPRVLRNNLRLLEASIEHFEREGFASPADDRGPFAKQRHLFATIQIEAKLLRDGKWLRYVRDAYASYAGHIYGYWLQALNLTAASPASVVEGLSGFVYPLQDETAIPVTLDRVGAFGYGYMANQIAALCMGTGAPEYATHPPSAFRPEPKPGVKPSFSLVIWDQVLLRNLSHSGKRTARALRIYRRHRCFDCGAHDPETPPRAPIAKRRHGFYWHRRQVGELGRGALAVTQQRFARMLRNAREESVVLGDGTVYYDALLATMRPEAAERFGGVD
jgi:hypothetical protein